MSTIEEVFCAKIISLGTAAGSRVYNEFLEQKPTMPAIGFMRTNTPSVRRAVDTGRRIFESASFRVEVVAESAASAAAVAAALYAGLDGWRGTILDVDVMRCHRMFEGAASIEDGDQFLKIIQQDYDLTYR